MQRLTGQQDTTLKSQDKSDTQIKASYGQAKTTNIFWQTLKAERQNILQENLAEQPRQYDTDITAY